LQHISVAESSSTALEAQSAPHAHQRSRFRARRRSGHDGVDNLAILVAVACSSVCVVVPLSVALMLWLPNDKAACAWAQNNNNPIVVTKLIKR
jgi:hypothetical protein